MDAPFPLRVIEARYIDGYRIWLRFDSGVVGEVDLKGELRGEVFEPLRDLNAFRAFQLDPGFDTIVWSNGADLAPEYLYFLAFRDDPSLRERFIEWGYLPGVESPGIGVRP